MEAENMNTEQQEICRIGPDARIEGTVDSARAVRLEGTVVGKVCGGGQVTLCEGGVVEGEVKCGEFVCEGTVKGNVVAKKSVLKAGAVIEGFLETVCLEVAAGAVIEKGLKLKTNVEIKGQKDYGERNSEQ